MSDVTQGHVLRKDEIQGDILHEYDGIEEADNQLPLWWLGVFFGTICFGIAYWFAHHEYGLRQLPGERYAAAVKEEQFQAEKQAKALAAAAAEKGLDSLGDNPDAVAAGAATFKGMCAACHGEKGEGKIGPNLTDNQWIHGGGAEDIKKVIETGVGDKGMPAWGPILGAAGVQQATAFVLSIRNTNVAGKEPQGEVYKEP